MPTDGVAGGQPNNKEPISDRVVNNLMTTPGEATPRRVPLEVAPHRVPLMERGQQRFMATQLNSNWVKEMGRMLPDIGLTLNLGWSDSTYPHQ